MMLAVIALTVALVYLRYREVDANARPKARERPYSGLEPRQAPATPDRPFQGRTGQI